MESNSADKPDYSFMGGTVNNNPRGSLSKKQRILVVAGGGAVLLILLILLGSLFFGGDKSAETSLKVAQMHTELIRVSEIGRDKARGQDARNFATTTNLTLASSEPSIVGLATKYQKVGNKQLEAGVDPETDKTLTEAEQRSQFDEVFTELLVTEIQEYRKELSNAFNSSSSGADKRIYTTLFDDLNDIVSAAGLDASIEEE